MDGKKSKFNFGYFYEDHFAVNADKFTKEEAEEKAINELRDGYDGEFGNEIGQWAFETKAYVKWRVGINGDGFRAVCWWLEHEQRKTGSVPAWIFFRRSKSAEKAKKE